MSGAIGHSLCQHAVRRRAGLLATVATLLLAACSTPPISPKGDNGPWSGRLALRIDSDPPQSISAGFELQGTPTTGSLQLHSPLGNTLAQVTWSPAGAELKQGSQSVRRATLDELTTDMGGTALPVQALFAWLQGRPQAAAGWQADLSRQAEGRITAQRLQPAPSAELRLIFQP